MFYFSQFGHNYIIILEDLYLVWNMDFVQEIYVSLATSSWTETFRTALSYAVGLRTLG